MPQVHPDVLFRNLTWLRYGASHHTRSLVAGYGNGSAFSWNAWR